jgi:hypothetical protein
MNDRGQLAMEGIKLVASLAAGAVVIAIVYQFAIYLELASKHTTHGLGGAQTNQWLNTGLDVVLPGAFLGLTFFGFVSYAVYVSGRGY